MSLENNVQFIGRLSAKEDMKYLDNIDRTRYINFIVIVLGNKEKQYYNEFWCVAYGKTADKILFNFENGDKIIVRGSVSIVRKQQIVGNYINKVKFNITDVVL